MPGSLNILHVTPSYYPAIQFGGPIQSVHLLNKTLVSQGVHVDVFTTNAGLEDKPEYAERGWKYVDGVQVHYFPYTGYIHYNFSPQLFLALLKQVKEYDLVHITAVWNFPVWAAATACIRAKIPYIVSPRGTIYPETVALKSTLFKKVYYQLFAKRCLQKAAAIHYTALDEQQKVSHYLQLTTPGFIIPNGLELPEFDSIDTSPPFYTLVPEVKGKPYLLFLSRINIKKGLDLLVEAFRIVSIRFPELMLVIAGPDNEGYGAVIKEKLAENNLLHKSIFPGMLTGEAKLAAYRNAGLFVLPSYSENFGMSVVEAMACGTPVVISDQVGIHQDIRQQNAGKICRLDAREIAEAIVEVLSSEEEYNMLSRNAKKMVKLQYDIEAVADKFSIEYKRVLQKNLVNKTLAI